MAMTAWVVIRPRSALVQDTGDAVTIYVCVASDDDLSSISYEWTSQLLLEDGVRLSYALRGAKDNPEMESFNGHLKNEALSLFLDARTIGDWAFEVEGASGAPDRH
jgi:hypothetical protein